ncbi:MAG TPA: HK97-gp10 family putative phage morphogenesis protein [Cyclobacteriaceae bacterium]|nr:HK97-gp10 family putative phage morphogenesis protein [Cyclobacteriaceae bacterium]
MKSSITVTGIKEIDAVFRGLKVEVSHKLLQSANEEAAKPLVDAAHLLAPVGATGNLAESIGVEKPRISRVDAVGQVNVGPRRGGKSKGHHAHLVEFGKTNRDGSKSKANPFMHKALDRSIETVKEKFNQIVGRRMVRLMKRTLKNA